MGRWDADETAIQCTVSAERVTSSGVLPKTRSMSRCMVDPSQGDVQAVAAAFESFTKIVD